MAATAPANMSTTILSDLAKPSTNLKLGDNQMKKYYDMLSPICEKLWIEIPEMYVELNVVPNAYTYGDTKPFIVLTSGLIYRNNTCKNLAYGRSIFDTLKYKKTKDIQVSFYN